MDTEGAPLGGVGETALGAALMRAQEASRSDPLFDDPYAAAFVAAAPPIFPDGPEDSPEIAALAEAFQAQVAVRTRSYDDQLLHACSQGCRQVVLLAAGLDARSFRLDWPSGVRVFELDLPEVLSFKQHVLDDVGASARCDRVPVPVDLRVDWPAQLVAAGFDPGRATAWTAEGLLAYLTHDAVAALLAAVLRLSAPGSRLAFENARLVDDEHLARARDLLVSEGLDDLWAGGLQVDAATGLRREGWEVTVTDGEAVARRYGRSLAGLGGVHVEAVRPAQAR